MAIEGATASVVQSGLAAMQSAQAALAESGRRIAEGPLVRPVEAGGESAPNGGRGAGVDLAAEAVGMIGARQQHAAGAAVVRAGDAMNRALIDLVA